MGAALLLWTVTEGAQAAELSNLEARAAALVTPEGLAKEPREAAGALRAILTDLGEPADLDGRLLRAYLQTRIAEIEVLELPSVLPASYVRLAAVEAAVRRTCATPQNLLAEAEAELGRMPELLRRARKTVSRATRQSVVEGLASVDAASALLDRLPQVCTNGPGHAAELRRLAEAARSSLDGFRGWLESLEAPIGSTPSATRKRLGEVHEWLDGPSWFDVGTLIAERDRLLASLASSGVSDAGSALEALLPTEWNWEDVLPAAQAELARLGAAQRLVESLVLAGSGAVRVLWLAGEDRPSSAWGVQPPYHPAAGVPGGGEPSLLFHNPYWTRLRAAELHLAVEAARAGAPPSGVRALYRSSCLQSARALYLSRRLQESGYFDGVEADQRQPMGVAHQLLRLFRVQSMIVEERAGSGSMSLEQAADSVRSLWALPEELARALASGAVRRSYPTSCGLAGERSLLELREAAVARGRSIDAFDRDLWRHGDLPLGALRELVEARTTPAEPSSDGSGI